jgi:uncharacterized protein YggE
MRRLKQGGLMALVLVLTGTLLGPIPGSAQESSTQDTVTVAASRSVDIEPDIGTIIFGVRSKGSTAESAIDKLSDRTRAVLDALRADGFTDEELSTESVTLDRRCIKNCRRTKGEDGPKPVTGYVASAAVRLETKRLEELGAAIDTGVSAGASSIRRVSFDLEDKTAAVEEALRQAMQQATRKAQVLAEAGDRQLGTALVITEGRTVAPRSFAVTADYLNASSAGTVGGSGSTSNPFPIEPPTLEASARVQVTFRLN